MNEADNTSAHVYAAASGNAFAFCIADSATGEITEKVGPLPLPAEYQTASSSAQAQFVVIQALKHLEARGDFSGRHALVFTDAEKMPTTWSDNKDAWRNGVDGFRLLSTRKPAKNPELWAETLAIYTRAAFTFDLAFVSLKRTIFKAGLKFKVANNASDALKMRVAKALAQSYVTPVKAEAA